MKFLNLSHSKSINRSNDKYYYTDFESGQVFSLGVIHNFLKRRHAKTIKVINDIGFYISSNPMRTTHVCRFLIMLVCG